MAEYIECRNCDSPYCKGCNLKNLEMMLNNGKFDCLMNENRCINTSSDVVLVRHGHIVTTTDSWATYHQNCSECGEELPWKEYPNFCHNCGAKMDG